MRTHRIRRVEQGQAVADQVEDLVEHGLACDLTAAGAAIVDGQNRMLHLRFSWTRGRDVPIALAMTPGAGGRRGRDGDRTNVVGRRRRTLVRRDDLVCAGLVTHVAHVTTESGKNRMRFRSLRISVAKNGVPASTKRVFRAPAKCEVER
jgi:hypothetical protein